MKICLFNVVFVMWVCLMRLGLEGVGRLLGYFMLCLVFRLCL